MLKSKNKEMTEDERVVDLLERIGSTYLYLNTDLGQGDIAHKLKMDINRVNSILKGIKKNSKTKLR